MVPNRLRDIIMNDSDFSDSDDELELIQVIARLQKHNGEGSSSLRRGRTVIDRDVLGGQRRLFDDYFAESPVLPPQFFRKRFRMSRSLFLRIHDAVVAHNSYFTQKRNCAGKLGLSSLQKITAVLRMLAYGAPADSVDEYVRIGASTTIKSLKYFVRAVKEIFSEEYLRSPNATDIARLVAVNETRGFPGMLGSLDCMHWKWKNCPSAWKGMYAGQVREPTIILEAVASYDLWIWHAFFGMAGADNDINVLERSPLFSELYQGHGPSINYNINGNDYTMGYYLTDGIYPEWATFVKTIPSPQDLKKKHFARLQESARKDVERAFGVLQARFAIVRGPAQFWHRKTLKDIMIACIIMHNMIVEDERDHNEVANLDFDQLDHTPLVEVSHCQTPELMKFIQQHHRVTDKASHSQLQADLIEHQWQMHDQA